MMNFIEDVLVTIATGARPFGNERQPVK